MYKLLCKIPVLKNVLTKKNRVNIVRLSGVIMPPENSSRRNTTINLDTYKDILDNAFSHPGVNAVYLIINSPGGSPVQSDLISNYILSLKSKYNLPVYAFVEDVAASGGYWIACVADKIYARPASIVGSIGVVSASFGFQDLIKNWGVERRVHTSGTQKSFMDPFQKEEEKDIKRLKDLQKSIHAIFKNWVKERRSETLKGTDKSLFDGQFWLGTEAIENGIIDGIGDVLEIAKSEYGDTVKLSYYKPESSLLGSLFKMEVSPNLEQINQDIKWAKFSMKG